MIYAYGLTQQGHYHIASGLVCQDAHRILRRSERMAVAAVADGLGSETRSDIAAKLAAERATAWCAEHIAENSPEEEILKRIREAFSLSQRDIERTAAERGEDSDQYDTTLSLAVLIGDTLYYGHSGDSGILALTTNGLYEKVTEQQRDEEGRVYPLYFGEEKWVFGKYPRPVASVLLATDGMYELFFPVYIRNEAVPVYTALARYFMDPQALHARELSEAETGERIGRFVASIPASQVKDDKTLVVLTDPEREIRYQPPAYYAEPDWPALKRKYEEAWQRAAYPQLFGED